MIVIIKSFQASAEHLDKKPSDTHRQKLDGVEAGEEVVPLEATVIFLKIIIFFPDQ